MSKELTAIANKKNYLIEHKRDIYRHAESDSRRLTVEEIDSIDFIDEEYEKAEDEFMRALDF